MTSIDPGARVDIGGQLGTVTETDALMARVTMDNGRKARIDRRLLKAAPEAKHVAGPPEDKAVRAKRTK
jgi:preprotein translocase subunit YajC